MDSRLIGLWEIDPEDRASISRYGVVRLHFFPTGDLTYTVRSSDRDEVIRLEYKTEGDVIATQQPSAPQLERTRYSISEDGKLSLDHGGVVSRYRRLR
jgi:hypothetical protein